MNTSRTLLDAGRPCLIEPGTISTVLTEFYVDHNEPMAAPHVSEIKEFQLRLCERNILAFVSL